MEFKLYDPLITSEVASSQQQLHGSLNTGKALDTAHCGRLETMPNVL